MECRSCHGDSDGNDVIAGGALTAEHCEDCGDLSVLASTIEATMPLSDPTVCDSDCAEALAYYIRDTFLGYGNNLTGEQLYISHGCVDCHGDGIETDGLSAARLVPSTCTSCSSESSIAQRIDLSMPFGNPGACIDDCADKIAAYIVNTFDGYNDLGAGSTDNLGLVSGVNIQAITDGVRLTWQSPDVQPNYWILERWDGLEYQWQTVARLNGNATRYDDTAHIDNTYRLFSVTEGIASLPTLVAPPSISIRSTGNDIWGMADSQHFSYISVSGDFNAELTLHSLDHVHPWSKAGLMVRESLNAGSRHAFVLGSGTNGLAMLARYDTDGVTTNLGGETLEVPVRLRLSRSNDTIRASAKRNNGTWVALGEAVMNLPEQVYIGVGQSSHSGVNYATARYGGFSVDNSYVNQLSDIEFNADAEVTRTAGFNSDASEVAISPYVEAKPLKRLSSHEYSNIMNEIHSGQDFVFDLDGDDARSGFDVGLSTSVLGIEKYLAAAEALAPSLADQRPIGCDPEADVSCLENYISEQALQYLRRPIAQSQRDILVGMYWDVATNVDAENALAALHEALAQTPSFLYKFEPHSNELETDTLVPVTGYEMAARLAFALWGGKPDATLLKAAADGALVTPAQIKAQAQRMVEDDRARRGFRQFYREWLHLDELAQHEKNLDGLNFDDDTVDAMLLGTDAFIDAVVFSDDYSGTLEDFFTAPVVGNSADLATYTGINSNNNDVHLSSTSGTAGGMRTGILGQPALLALLAHTDTTSIVHRGVFVNSQFMCNGFPPPPDDAPTLDSIDPSNKSSREVLDELTSPNLCAGCHKFINDVGATFEHFDAVGRYRTRDDLGANIDALGTIYSRKTSASLSQVNGLNELNQFLTSQPEVKTCFATQFLTYATGHVPSPAERRSVDWLAEQMDDNDWHIKTLLVEATQTPLFLYKRTH